LTAYLMNIFTGDLRKACRLCFEPMCFVATEDEDGYEDLWWHCHDCDMRDCDEEAYED
jgi:hypothetical protein